MWLHVQVMQKPNASIAYADRVWLPVHAFADLHQLMSLEQFLEQNKNLRLKAQSAATAVAEAPLNVIARLQLAHI